VRDATLRRIALVSYAVFVIGIIAGQAMGARSHAGDAVFPLVLFAFPTVGIAVLNKRPREWTFRPKPMMTSVRVAMRL